LPVRWAEDRLEWLAVCHLPDEIDREAARALGRGEGWGDSLSHRVGFNLPARQHLTRARRGRNLSQRADFDLLNALSGADASSRACLAHVAFKADPCIFCATHF